MYLKKETKKYLVIGFLAALAVFAFSPSAPVVFAATTTEDEASRAADEDRVQAQKQAEAEKKAKEDAATAQLNKDRAARAAKLQQINAQIKNYQQEIGATQQKSNTLKGEISIFDRQISSTELQIQAKETQIEDADLQIGEIQRIIAQKSSEIAQNKEILGQLIVQLSQLDDQYIIRATLATSKLSEFFDELHYTSSIQDRVYQLLQKVTELKAKLERDEAELKVQLAGLKELKTQLDITKQSLDEQRGQKQSLLTQTRGIEKNYQKLLVASKEDEANLQKEIDDLDAQIRAKVGKKTVSANKGVFAWPIDGVLTQKYGNTGFTALGYNFHNGIDIAGPAGTPLYAVADGTVTYTDSSDAAYGNWVTIKHTIKTKSGGTANVISLYGHMRSYKVRPGQQVQQGDLIGYEGNTGNTTRKLYGPERGYHIHFGVYDAEGFGVNPGAYTKIYGNYKIPYGYTYNPLDFLQ